MKLRNKLLINIGLAFVISTLVVSLSNQGVFRRLEAAGTDMLFRLRGPLPFNPSVVIVEIADRDIEIAGRWPWPREWHAALTAALRDFGAGMIYFDIIFSEPSSRPEEDLAFAEAIEYAGNVYLPFAFLEKDKGMEAALSPVDVLAGGLRGTGSINIYPDIDGTIRNLPAFFAVDGRLYPHIALKLAMERQSKELVRVEKDRLVLASEEKETYVPIVAGRNIPINWLGKWADTFVHYSYLDLLAAYRDVREGKTPAIDIGPIKDSICLVAVTGIGLYDIRPTPMEPEYPGVGAIATVISTILDGRLINPAPLAVNIVLIYLLGLAPFLFISGEKSLREIMAVALVGVAFFFGVVTLFRQGYKINYVLPLISLVASYTTVATFHFVRVSMERQKFFHMAVTDSLTGLANIRYFMMIIGAELMLARRESGQRGFCVIMIDIDNFKKFNDTYGHAVGDLVLKETAGVLRSSVRASDLVARYGGEEMVILLRATHISNAVIVAEKIRGNVEAHELRDDRNTYKVTISLGVAELDAEKDDADSVIKRADAGLYRAKENGRNRVETVTGGHPGQ